MSNLNNIGNFKHTLFKLFKLILFFTLYCFIVYLVMYLLLPYILKHTLEKCYPYDRDDYNNNQRHNKIKYIVDSFNANKYIRENGFFNTNLDLFTGFYARFRPRIRAKYCYSDIN